VKKSIQVNLKKKIEVGKTEGGVKPGGVAGGENQKKKTTCRRVGGKRKKVGAGGKELAIPKVPNTPLLAENKWVGLGEKMTILRRGRQKCFGCTG